MGTKMGPNYANLFVGYVEERIFDQFDGPVPELFGRYIDDCFGATSSGRPELDRFIQFVNTFHPALEFIWEISTSSVTFLHINFSIQNDGSLQTHRFAQLFASFLIPSASRKKIQFLTLNFSGFVDFAVTTLISRPKPTKCAIVLPNATIQTLSSPMLWNVSTTSVEKLP